MYCDYTSDQSNNMKRHAERKHPENNKFITNVTISKTYKCKFCNYSSDQSNNVIRHARTKHVEEQNEKKTPQKEVTPLQKEVCEKMEYQSTLDMTALKNEVISEINEYERKLELGREVKRIVLKLNVPTACLSKENMEALQLFNNRGQVKDVKLVEWRPSQKELLEHVNNPTPRRVIWVVGEGGDEGKDFFQNHIEEQYGKQRVCTMTLAARSKDILHCMRKSVSSTERK